jgi:hypothetical protein
VALVHVPSVCPTVVGVVVAAGAWSCRSVSVSECACVACLQLRFQFGDVCVLAGELSDECLV